MIVRLLGCGNSAIVGVERLPFEKVVAARVAEGVVIFVSEVAEKCLMLYFCLYISLLVGVVSVLLFYQLIKALIETSDSPLRFYS
jgi:hypothetical protein